VICFRDMTFCAAAERCATADCPRRFGPAEEAAARQWWGSDADGEGPPVAFADFSGRDCFIPPEQPTTSPAIGDEQTQAEPHSGEPKQTPAPSEEGE
jgi:hypothetical protein